MRSYLDWLQETYGRLSPVGVGGEQVALDLAAAHVPLRVVERGVAEAHARQMRGEGGAEGSDELAAGPTAIFTPLGDPQLIERAAQNRQARTPGRPDQAQLKDRPPQAFTRLLLLGDAGSGKTTTLRFAAQRCAEAYGRGDPRILSRDLGLELTRPPMPIYVRLAELAAALPATAAGAPAEQFLASLDQSAVGVGLPAGTLSGLIRQPDGCLLLLDGLDEVDDEGTRARVAELIDSLAAAHPNHRYVVASRPIGYGGQVHLTDFVERHLSPLDGDEIRALFARWYAAVQARPAPAAGAAPQEDAQAQSDRLWGAIERNERLFELASSPLLAATIALIQLNHGRLPTQRAALYRELVERLLDRWHRQSAADDATALDAARIASERLALQMQQQPDLLRSVTPAQAEEWLGPLLAERLQLDPAAATAQARALLESLALSSGLLQRHTGGYSFAHYTLQEYLAARAIDNLGASPGADTSVAFLLSRSADPRWREILLLAAGHWSNSEQFRRASQLVRGLLESDDNACVLLAAEALADIGPVGELAEPQAAALARLPSLAFDPNHTPDLRWRIEAGELLDRLGGDGRPSLDPLRPEYWAERIEPGLFMFEEQTVQRWVVEGSKRTQREERVPAYTYQIRRPYALARFPVTNRQYLAFLEDLERQRRLDEANERRPRNWPGRRYRPGSGNHPVTMVTWYDATAYAAWLDRRLHDQGLLGVGEELRLPTEPEWERAAAYPVVIPPGDMLAFRREYPWGDWPEQPDAQPDGPAVEQDGADAPRANTIELGLGGTSPVGIFPHGAAACGAEELAGNVWEWCSSASQDHPLPPDLRVESIDTERRLVLRGGSCLQGRRQAHCGARFGFMPINFDANFGFRIARLFPHGRT